MPLDDLPAALDSIPAVTTGSGAVATQVIRLAGLAAAMQAPRVRIGAAEPHQPVRIEPVDGAALLGVLGTVWTGSWQREEAASASDPVCVRGAA
jgi:hypothetical protein